MAVTFVIGNASPLGSYSLFMPGNSITSALANEFAEATPGLYTAALVELGLILFFITFVVLSLSKLLLFSLEKKWAERHKAKHESPQTPSGDQRHRARLSLAAMASACSG